MKKQKTKNKKKDVAMATIAVILYNLRNCQFSLIKISGTKVESPKYITEVNLQFLKLQCNSNAHIFISFACISAVQITRSKF